MKNTGSRVRGQGTGSNIQYLLFCIYVVCTIYILQLTVRSADAYADDLSTVIANVQKTYEGINDIQADFTQLTTSASIKETQKSTGIVYLKKPGMMKWEYKNSVKDIIVSDGITIWVYQHDIGQVMITDASNNSSSISSNFLAGIGNLKKDFDVELAEGENNTHLLKMIPKTPQPNIQKLNIAIDKKTFLAISTIVYDMLGNETKVIFEKIKPNQSLSDKIFKFNIPKGVKVVKQ